MLSYIVTCVLVMMTAVKAAPSFTRNYTSWQQLLPTYQIYWTVNETSQEIYLGFKVQTTGWFGFGIAEPSSGSMPGADIMTANVTNGHTAVIDRFSIEYAQPLVDEACGDWQPVYGDESDGVTLVEVTRKLDTGDHDQDRVIPSGSIPVIFSHSADGSDQLSYHGNNRGTGFITFYGISQPQPSDLLKDPSVTVSFPQISNFQIPPQQTTYMCQSFELPIDQIRHIIAFEPVVNSTVSLMVHHGIIHSCTSDAPYVKQYKTPGQCESPIGNIASGCTDILFAWARGGQPFVVPAETGFRVSDGSDGGTFNIVLQLHYDNPTLRADAIDRSGFKLYMTSQLRPHDAGVLVMGDVWSGSAPIPRGSAYTEYEYACSPTCTQQLNTSLQVFGDLPHMHAYGSRIWTTRWRNGTQLQDAERTEYFAWTMQKNIALNFTILPGDRFNTHCAYNTQTAPADVTFGKNSTQEMCLEFFSYWPKQNGFYYCGGYFLQPINNNISICEADTLMINNGTDFEINNPSQWGFDPIAERLRHFGNDMNPPTGLTCPLIKDIYVPPPTNAPTNASSATNAPTNTPTNAPTNGSINSNTSSSSSSSGGTASSSSSTGGSGIGVNTASTTTPIIMISFMMSIIITIWN